MLRNTADQRITLYVYNKTTGSPATGRAAVLKVSVNKDDGGFTLLTNSGTATEDDDVAGPGDYSIVLTQAETNAIKLRFAGYDNGSANNLVVAQTIYTDTVDTGTGARSVTITVNDGATALESAHVRFTKGSESYVGTTNASGVIAFSLDDGTWTVTITLAGYSFTPTTLAVSTTTTHTYSMTAASFTPSNPGETTGYLYCYTEAGVVEQNVVVTCTLVAAPTTAGLAYDNRQRSGTSDVNGLVQFTGLMAGCTYRVRRGGNTHHDTTIASSPAATTALGPVVGNEAP